MNVGKKRKLWKLHRLVYYAFNNELPEHIHHINFDRSDNSLSNLRGLTHEEHKLIEHHSKEPWGYSKRIKAARKRQRQRILCNESGKIYRTQREAAENENCGENGVCKVLGGQLTSTNGKTFVLLEDKE